MNKKQTMLLAASVGLAVASQINAGEPMAIEMGAVSLTPTLDASLAYDDNIRESGINPINSWVTTIAPTVLFSAQDHANTYQLGYSFNSQFFHSSSDNNNTDHHLSANTHWEFGDANRLDLSAGYDDMEDVQDTTNLLENDMYHTTYVGGVYGLGSEAAIFHVDLGVNNAWKRYDNTGTLNKDRENDKLGLQATGYYAITPILSALLEVRQNDYDYILASFKLDSTSSYYLAGLKWELSELTTGLVKVGRVEKDFDHASFDDPSENTWDVGVSWKPLSYSTFTLSASRDINEGSVTENFIKATNTSLTWNHSWTSYLSSDINIMRIKEDYDNVEQRQDDTDQLGLNLTYEFRRWLKAGIGYTYRERDSNVAIRSFDHNVYMLNLDMSL